jgi:pimeloyl-ACP methyl ester carboxylesterase
MTAATAPEAPIVRSERVTLDGVRFHYLAAGSGRPLVLLHGFPQTSHLWRGIIPAFAEERRVIAPDYRGAGDSDCPPGGYDKATMAEDIWRIVDAQHPGESVSVVGHDMGAFVAFAMAAAHPDRVDRLCLIDAPVLGTTAWNGLAANPRAWHIGFHAATDVAVGLVSGREDPYLRQFFHARAYDPAAVEPVVDDYVRRYSMPGRLRAAFSAYRELASDATANAALLQSFRLPMPLLVMAGELSNSGRTMIPMLDEVAVDGTFLEIARAGHWIVEEQPAALITALRDFL